VLPAEGLHQRTLHGTVSIALSPWFRFFTSVRFVERLCRGLQFEPYKCNLQIIHHHSGLPLFHCFQRTDYAQPCWVALVDTSFLCRVTEALRIRPRINPGVVHGRNREFGFLDHCPRRHNTPGKQPIGLPIITKSAVGANSTFLQHLERRRRLIYFWEIVPSDALNRPK
jgi:hypothetical protein